MTVAIPVTEGRASPVLDTSARLWIGTRLTGWVRYRRVSTQTDARIHASAPNTSQYAAAVRYHDK
jgi:hypothetical protein